MLDAREIRELKDLLRVLEKKDQELRVFGADGHRYQLAPPLVESELRQFEEKNKCKLPADYRIYLKDVANGGAGPYYGLVNLEEAARYCNLSRPFPITTSTKAYSPEELIKFGLHDDYPGILEICHQGCAIYSYLVVNGPAYGTIWDGREDFFPTQLSFADWYRRWIRDLKERVLPLLENEKVIERIKVGMNKSEVCAICNHQGLEKQVAGMIFLNFPHLRTEFELNGEGMVTRIIKFQI